jgi:histidyl-tRNA synthetase
MQPVIKRPNGTADILPQDMNKWHTAEKIAADTASGFGFREIRIPTFEVPELFSRGVGDTTDIVQKEMYRVTAKDTEFVLRPEGTAGTVRAVLQNGLLNGAMPLKLFYILSCFRHERPQAGRLREFHQFGLEMFGAKSASADAEVIMLVSSILERLELKNIRLKINSIGCRICREEYYEQLRAYFTPHKEHLCETCLTRLEKNPMRILDCKSPECREIAENAPVILDFLCDECRGHFSDLKASLTDIE